MPTIGERPSLKETQAVGATLLYQFARQRFSQAGIDDSLIREVEAREHLDTLASALIVDEDDLNESHSTTANCSSVHNETGNTSLRSTGGGNNNNNTTIHSFAGDTHNVTEERFHSMAESSVVNGSRQEDRTMYHSINAGNHSESSITNGNGNLLDTSPLDRLQSSPCLAAYGRELRRMAEEFENSRLRRDVKRRAEKVNLSDITKESFIALLEELFQEDITREKIVILFFFCTDVALRAVSFASDLVIKLLGWSFSYIIETVCSFVHKLGGWDKVLFYQFPSILISCCAALAAVSLLVYLRKNLLRD